MHSVAGRIGILLFGLGVGLSSGVGVVSLLFGHKLRSFLSFSQLHTSWGSAVVPLSLLLCILLLVWFVMYQDTMQ